MQSSNGNLRVSNNVQISVLITDSLTYIKFSLLCTTKIVDKVQCVILCFVRVSH